MSDKTTEQAFYKWFCEFRKEVEEELKNKPKFFTWWLRFADWHKECYKAGYEQALKDGGEK